MKGKGIFVRKEVDLSVKGKGGFVCGKGFFLCGRKNDFIRRERSCRPKDKETLFAEKGSFVRRRRRRFPWVNLLACVCRKTFVRRAENFYAHASKFTLSEDKQLEVRLYERGGGRTLAFYLDEEDLLLARKIDNLKLKW